MDWRSPQSACDSPPVCVPLSVCCSFTVLHFFHVLTTWRGGISKQRAAVQSQVPAFINRGGTMGGGAVLCVLASPSKPGCNVWVEICVSDLQEPHEWYTCKTHITRCMWQDTNIHAQQQQPTVEPLCIVLVNGCIKFKIRTDCSWTFVVC